MLPQKTQKYWDILKELAQEALEKDEVPVAALLVYRGDIIAMAHNEVEEVGDPTLHAEMTVLKRGFELVGKKLDECEIYITLEPCPMCAHAITLAQVKAVFFGAYDPRCGAVEHGERIFTRLPTTTTVVGGCHEAYFSDLLSHFFKSKR